MVQADGERARLTGPDAADWRRWGPYLSERAWGTVREDYSAEGDAWEFFPHEHARSRAYRWNEDGLAGLSDDQQLLCFSLGLWNGVDPILKERAFGLTGPQGNHGEDVKEYWWFVDSTPTHSWMRWRYVYPQRPYPYEDLVEENARRTRLDPEYELLDTGVLDDDRYFDVTVDYAKAAADDVCLRITVTNRGPDTATIHLLPTLWFRDTWSWDPGSPIPALHAVGEERIVAEHVGARPHGAGQRRHPRAAVLRQRDQHAAAVGHARARAYPKDGINDHVVQRRRHGEPGADGHEGGVPPRARARPGRGARHPPPARARRPGRRSPTSRPGGSRSWRPASRRRTRSTASCPPGRRRRRPRSCAPPWRGCSGASSTTPTGSASGSTGDPGRPAPPPERWKGRNRQWQNLDAEAVVSMPDPWEYPWFAAWDLAFHCVTLAHVDPEFAKAAARDGRSAPAGCTRPARCRRTSGTSAP